MAKRITPTDDKLHHEYGGSTSKRWIICTGSMPAIKKEIAAGLIPAQQVSGPAAEEGTRAHNLGELCIIKGYDPDDFFMQEFEGATITEDYISAVRVYINYCNEIKNNPSTISWAAEESYDLTDYVDGADCGGSADFSAVYENGDDSGFTLEIDDYKHGRGVMVSIEGNTQARLYALGALLKLKKDSLSLYKLITDIKMAIIQPRISHTDGPIRDETITKKELLKWGRSVVKPAIKTNERGGGVFVAGDHCTFCPRSGYCTALAEENMEIARQDFATIEDELPMPATLTKNQIELLLLNADRIKKWLGSVEVYATNAADLGEDFNNFKLVERYGHRKFSNSDKRIVRKLKKAGYDSSIFFETKTVTPAKLEAALRSVGTTGKGAKEFVDLVTFKPEIGRSLTKLTDGREIAKTSAESDFADVVKSKKKPKTKKITKKVRK